MRTLAVVAGGGRCDNSPLGSWVRFTGLDPATGALSQYLPEYSPGVGSCGVSAGGWLQNGHPQQWNGTVTRSVCFSLSSGSPCATPISVNITNCGGGVILYQLPVVPTCNVAAAPYGYGYCTTSDLPPSLGRVPPPSPPPPLPTPPSPSPSPPPPPASPSPPVYIMDALSSLPVQLNLYQWFTGSGFGLLRASVWEDQSGNSRPGIAVGPVTPVRSTQRLGFGARDVTFVSGSNVNSAVVFAGEDTEGASAASPACSSSYVQGGLRAEYFNLTTETQLLSTVVSTMSQWSYAQFPSPVGRVPITVRSQVPFEVSTSYRSGPFCAIMRALLFLSAAPTNIAAVSR